MVYLERSSASATCSAERFTRNAPRSSRRLTTSIFSSRDMAAGVLPISPRMVVTMPATTSRMSPAKISPGSGAASPPSRPTAVRLARARWACTISEMSTFRPSRPKGRPCSSLRVTASDLRILPSADVTYRRTSCASSAWRRLRSMRSVGGSPTARPVTAPFSMATIERGRRETSCSTTSQSAPNISARPRTSGRKAVRRGSSGSSDTGPPCSRPDAGAPGCGRVLDVRYTPTHAGVSKRVGYMPGRVGTRRGTAAGRAQAPPAAVVHRAGAMGASRGWPRRCASRPIRPPG